MKVYNFLKKLPFFILVTCSINVKNLNADFNKIKFLICPKDIKKGLIGPLSATSDVEIFKDENIVKKRVRSYLQYNVFNREVDYLMKLRDFAHVPKLLYTDFDNHIIYMTYGGQRITKENLPSDWPKASQRNR